MLSIVPTWSKIPLQPPERRDLIVHFFWITLTLHKLFPLPAMLSPNHWLLQVSSEHTSPPHLQDQAFPGSHNPAILSQPVGFIQEATVRPSCSTYASPVPSPK